MLTNSIIQSLCEPQFALRSLSDYAERRASVYASLISALSDAIDAEPEDPVSLADDDLPFNVDSELYVGDGCYLPFSELRSQIVSKVNAYCDGDEILNFDITGSGDVTTTISSAMQRLKDDLYSVKCMAGACAAAAKDNFADRTLYFKSYLEDTFNSNYQAATATLASYRELLSNATDAGSFMEAISNFMSVPDQVEATDSSDVAMIIEASDASQFTGASPAGPLNFSNAGKAIATTLKVGAAVVGGVFAGVGKIAGKAFRWITSSLNKIAVNPDDMELANENGEPIFQNFRGCWKYSGVARFGLPFADIQAAFPGVTPSALRSAMADGVEVINEWVQYRTYGGIYFAHLTDISNVPNVHAGLQTDFNVGCDQLVFLPYCLDMAGLSTIPEAILTSADPNEINAWLNNFKNSDKYANKRTSENNKMLGLFFAYELDNMCLSCAYNETTHRHLDYIIRYSYSDSASNKRRYVTRMWIPPQEWFNSSEYTNANFFNVATGFTADNAFQRSFDATDIARNAPNYDSTLTYVCEPMNFQIRFDLLIRFYLLSKLDQLVDPLNFSWMPYTSGTASVPDGKWTIRTDDMNRDAFNTFMTTAIIIAVVAVTAIVAGVAVKKISRRLFFKRTATVGRLDNKMWNGGTLTKKEQRQYLRAKRKLNAGSLLNGGLNDGNSSSNSPEKATEATNSDQVLSIGGLIR